MQLSGALELDLSGIALRLEGLSAAVERGVRRDWQAFVASGLGPPFLRCRFAGTGVDAGSAPFRPKAMRAERAGSGARFALPEGEAWIEAGEARIVLACALGLREYWTAVNLLRACLAWRMADRGGALVHSAGLVVDGRAFLLVGAPGSGKSSFAALGERAGARVLSDDLVLLDRADGAFEALGAPFRSTHVARYGPGRWPLAAVLFPRRGSPAAWVPCRALTARARILANLPFVSDAALGAERSAALVDRLASDVPCLELTFGLDPTFVELLRRPPPRTAEVGDA